MSAESLAMHYVCMFTETKDLIEKQDEFWVANCGCREDKGGCQKSRMDICLYFSRSSDPSGSNLRKISRAEVEVILQLAQEKNLVIRPFRKIKQPSEIEGICFCCDCCCSYFLSADEKCDPGKFIEKTDIEECLLCGSCIEVCYFQARKVEDDRLSIQQDNCYGCGLCTDLCPVNCITMIRKTVQ